MSVSAPPTGLQADFSLARLTTVRTGGRAQWFARAGGERQLLELLGWASAAGLRVSVVGSGSNLLVADEGVSGLVLKLDRELARIEVRPPRMVCGAGARLPALAAQAARAGLSGIEFGVSIPGTVGGAVRMNANAYDGQLGQIIEWVELAITAPQAAAPERGPEALAPTNPRVERRTPAQLGLAYRSSGLVDGEIVMRASFVLQRAAAERVRATIAEMRARRHEAQPQGIRTFGSTFKNPRDAAGEGRTAGQLLSDAGCNGLTVGGARFALKHANFVENMGSATTADIVGVMALGRERVLERFGVALEPEAQTLGDVRFPW